MLAVKYVKRDNRELFPEWHNLNRQLRGVFAAYFGRDLLKEEDFKPTPDVHVYDKKDSLVVKAKVPGYRSEDIRVQLDGGLLSITGEAKKDEERKDKSARFLQRYHRYFQRNFCLSHHVDASRARATYTHGVLELALPKADKAQKKGVTIKVR